MMWQFKLHPADDASAGCSWNCHIIQLTRDQIFELGNEALTFVVRILLVDDGSECIDLIAIDEDLELLQFVGTVFEELIIKRSIAFGA